MKNLRWERLFPTTVLKEETTQNKPGLVKLSNLPVMIPLANPGMPWIEMTLLWTKYSSQVALRRREEQKRPQSRVVTVSFPSQASLAQTSKPWRDSVRFPRRQILGRDERKKDGMNKTSPWCHRRATESVNDADFTVPHPESLSRPWSSGFL